jgi:hypothetical protein
MNTRFFSRTRLSVWIVAALVGTSFVAVAPAAQALDSVGPTGINFTRQGTDSGQMTVKDGEAVTLQSSHILDPAWSGFPLKKAAVLTRTAFTANVPTGVTIDEYSSSRSWYGWSDDEFDDCDVYDDAARFVVSNYSRCMDWLNVTDYISVRNDSGSTKTVSTNASSQVLKNGKRVVSGAGTEKGFVGLVRNENINSYTIDSSTESYISFDFEMCLVEEDVEPNDALTIVIDVTRGVNDLTSSDYDVYEWDEGDGDEEWENDVTYNVSGDGLADDTRVNFTVEVPQTLSGNYAAIATVRDGASSVIEECADNETAAWPTVTNRDDGPGSDLSAEINTISFPTYGSFNSDDWDSYSNTPDGFGEMFYSVKTAEDEVRVVHFGPTNDTTTFNNNTGYVDIDTDENGFYEIGRYGTNDGENFFALAETSTTAWTLTLGSRLANGTSATTVSLTNKSLARLCPVGFKANWLSPISASTTNPMIYLSCAKGKNNRPVIFSWANGRATSVATLGAPTAARPCVVPTIGIDTRATGTDAAIIVYTRTSARDSEGFCTSIGLTSATRSLMTISAAGVRSTVTNIADPWSGNGEPAYLELAAGSAKGTWIGVSYDSGEDMYSPAPLGGAFTITGTTMALGSAITLDDSTDFGDWVYVQPVDQISSVEWVISITGSVTDDGANVGLATLAYLNPTTGEVTNGDVVETTDFGYFSSRMLHRTSRDSSGNSELYVVTGAGSSTSTYKAVFWPRD